MEDNDSTLKKNSRNIPKRTHKIQKATAEISFSLSSEKKFPFPPSVNFTSRLKSFSFSNIPQ